MRRTQATLKVVLALMDDPHGRHWGYDLLKRAGTRSGVLYPILHRMLDEGWLADGWEEPASIDGRPPRRYYEVTPEGLAAMGAMVAAARADARLPRLKGLPA